MSDRIPHHIKSIFVSRLFGRYTYALPGAGEQISDVNILYGENGLGKTTLLSLVFHLLSPSPASSHRAAISGVPFHQLDVELLDGTRVTATKDHQLLSGTIAFRIEKGEAVAEWNYAPNRRTSTIKFAELPPDIDVDRLPESMKDEVKDLIAQGKYFAKLSELKVVPFMLTADRVFIGDASDSLDKDTKRRLSVDSSSTRSKVSELVAEQRTATAAQALAGATSWLQAKFFEKSYGAGESASTVYQEVVVRIATTPYRTSSGLLDTQHQAQLRDVLTQKINDLNSRSKAFSTLGLPKASISENLLQTIRESSGNKLNLINNVLEPHLAELKARLDSIEPFYSLVKGFVSNVNKFFRDKSLVYTLRNGVQIWSSDLTDPTEIQPNQLSSGEQQLLAIFCHVLTARDTPSIFIIDEPEISLNILWQRMLITSLQELSQGSQSQFLFASHSMEILAKHRNRVISLVTL